jgi:putative hydrolase
MILTADFHTHTTYSHGKGTVLQNATEAKAKGLQMVGITDHGFAHSVFGLSKKKIPQLITDCKNATEQTGVKVLVGVEANLTSTAGDVDLKPSLYDSFDIFLAGIHKMIIFKAGSWFRFGIPNLLYSTFNAKTAPKGLVKRTTNAVVQAIKKNPIDVVTHLNFCSYLDPVEVAKVASDYGTYIELNSKKVHLSDEDLFKVYNTGVRFVIDSDAHTPDRVGEISLIEQTLQRTNFPLDRIDNINGKLPNFRFKAFKEK